MGLGWGSTEQMLLCWAPKAGTAGGLACIYGRGNGLCFSHPSLGPSYLLARFDKFMASCWKCNRSSWICIKGASLSSALLS